MKNKFVYVAILVCFSYCNAPDEHKISTHNSPNCIYTKGRFYTYPIYIDVSISDLTFEFGPESIYMPDLSTIEKDSVPYYFTKRLDSMEVAKLLSLISMAKNIQSYSYNGVSKFLRSAFILQGETCLDTIYVSKEGYIYTDGVIKYDKSLLAYINTFIPESMSTYKIP